jgi:hypothetical protein
MKSYIFAATLLVLVSCTYVVGEYSTYFEPTRDQSTIKVVWTDNPNDVCKKYINTDKPILGCSIQYYNDKCTVYMKQPNNFNDKEALALFGHEVLHCFGAKHE